MFETSTLNEEQKQNFDLLNFTNKKVHTLQGHPSSRKTFFVKYLPTHQLQLQGKKMLLLITIGVADYDYHHMHLLYIQCLKS
jgi:hypothetical protein